MKEVLISIFLLSILLVSCTPEVPFDIDNLSSQERREWFESASKEEKKEQLNPQQYHVLVNRKMEAAFTGKYLFLQSSGEFYSGICHYPVFSTEHLFDAKSGWLDFTAVNLSSVRFEEEPRTKEMQILTPCGEYLGYVEDDEAVVSGKHFIINSAALEFRP